MSCGACVAVSMAQVSLSYGELVRDNGKSAVQVFVAVCVVVSWLQCLLLPFLRCSVYVAVSLA